MAARARLGSVAACVVAREGGRAYVRVTVWGLADGGSYGSLWTEELPVPGDLPDPTACARALYEALGSLITS